MKTEFSPGPWQLKSPYKKPVSIWDKEDKLIVSVVHGEDLSNRQSNANLIAAAPELLEAIERILSEASSPDFGGGFSEAAHIKAKNALDKAKGKSQYL